jgi:hypothetical protein
MPYPLFQNIPPCPGDPAYYTLVKRGKKHYWRLKRGSIKPAHLNSTLAHRQEVMKMVSPFVKEIRALLLPYMKHMDVTNLHQRLYKKCEAGYASTDRLDFNSLQHTDLQPTHVIGELLDTNYTVRKDGDILHIKIDASPAAVIQHNNIVTEFAFEFLTIHGGPGNLVMDAESSPLFDIAKGLVNHYLHELRVPTHLPWMVILKVSCFEGKERARSGRHYGMKVVAVG